jgi:hypothetical protein
LLLGNFTISAKNYLRDGEDVAYWQPPFYSGGSHQHFCKAHAFFLAVFLWYPTYAHKGISINGGDTLTLSIGRKPLKICLGSMDAPENGQPYVGRSKKALSNFCWEKRQTTR